jgi:hypothetical protein
MDAISEQHCHLGDFLELEIDATDIVLADPGRPYPPARARVGVEPVVPAAAVSPHYDIDLVGTLSTLRGRWHALSPLGQVAVVIVASGLVGAGMTALLGLGSKAAAGHAIGAAAAHAALVGATAAAI